MKTVFNSLDFPVFTIATNGTTKPVVPFPFIKNINFRVHVRDLLVESGENRMP